jgi:hypothetical protein
MSPHILPSCAANKQKKLLMQKKISVWVGGAEPAIIFRRQFCARAKGSVMTTGKLQMAMFPPKSDWVPPMELTRYL